MARLKTCPRGHQWEPGLAASGAKVISETSSVDRISKSFCQVFIFRNLRLTEDEPLSALQVVQSRPE
jgi:hypothetical protein